MEISITHSANATEYMKVQQWLQYKFKISLVVLLTKDSDEYVDIVEPDLTEEGQHLVHNDPSV